MVVISPPQGRRLPADHRPLGLQHVVDLLHVAIAAAAGRNGEAAAHDGQLAALALGRDRRRTADAAERRDADRRQHLQHRLGRGGAARRLLGGHRRQHRAERMDAQPLRNRHRIRPQLGEHDLLHRPAVHRQRAGQALEQDETPGVEIRARRHRFAAQLFRRGIAGRAEQLGGGGQSRQLPARRVGDDTGQPEVEHHGVAPRAGLREHDVVGLEIAVHDSLGVGAAQGVEHLAHEVDRLAGAERPFRRERLAQRRPRHQLEHGVQGRRVGPAGIDQADDVGMGERGAQLHLAAEALAARGTLRQRQIGRQTQQLDGDRLSGRQLHPADDAPEAADGELVADLVAVIERQSTKLVSWMMGARHRVLGRPSV